MSSLHLTLKMLNDFSVAFLRWIKLSDICSCII